MKKAQFREFREKRGLTQEQVAKQLNIKQSSYSAYESGKNEPGLEKLVALSKIFHVTIDELLGVSNPNVLNLYSLLPEERSLIENIKKLSKENIMKVEAYVFSKLEEQNKK